MVSLAVAADYMTEHTRNMMGFMIVPMTAGVGGILLVSFLRKRLPSFWPVFGLLGWLGLLGYMVFLSAWFLDLPCAYVFTVLRMPSAISVNGVPVAKIIKGKGGHWVTDDYFARLCGDHDNLTAMRLETPSNSTDYYFAYDSRTRVVVPMTPAAAAEFPAFMPSGDELVGVFELNGNTNSTTTWMGGNEIKLPGKWFRASIRGEP